ncbi:MAG: hypothetical protein WDN75_05480 [Bacteroidota bacterium]
MSRSPPDTGIEEVPKALQGRYVGMDEGGKDTDTVIVESWDIA